MKRVGPLRSVGEAFGIRHGEVEASEGVLTLAALGVDPPTNSTHFAGQFLSLSNGVIRLPEVAPTEAERSQIVAAMPKLNTRTVTFVEGEAVRHGLVWEGRGDMETRSPIEAAGKTYREVRPEGDADTMLRTLIEDSVNLLGEMEFNQRREDEGKLPFNLFWPWGQGVRGKFPNLALLRGTPLTVATESIDISGLARLVGYRPMDRSLLGSGLPFKFTALPRSGDYIGVLDSPGEFARLDQLDEMDWWLRELGTKVVDPIMDRRREEPIHLMMILSSDVGGLAVTFDSERPHPSGLPFDERALEDRATVYGISDLVAEHFA